MATLHLLFPSTQENAIPASFCFEQHPNTADALEECDCRKCLVLYQAYHLYLADETRKVLAKLAS